MDVAHLGSSAVVLTCSIGAAVSLSKARGSDEPAPSSSASEKDGDELDVHAFWGVLMAPWLEVDMLGRLEGRRRFKFVVPVCRKEAWPCGLVLRVIRSDVNPSTLPAIAAGPARPAVPLLLFPTP